MVEHSTVQHLAQDLMAGRLSRRGFMKRAAALGLSASAISTVLASPVRDPGRRWRRGLHP